MSGRSVTGKQGEEAARDWLLENGFDVIARNWRGRTGEIDIIALENDTIVFIEVKTWPSLGMDSLEYAINASKQGRIIETSKYFLLLNRQYNCLAVRYDVVLYSGRDKSFHHLRAAFTE